LTSQLIKQNNMKNFLLLFTMLIGLSSFGQTKISEKDKEKALKRAESESSFVAKHMNMNEKDKTFVFNTFYTRFLYVATYAGANKGVDRDYKKKIFKKSRDWTVEELNKRFSEAETQQILTLLKTKRDHDKKNRW